MPPRRGKRIAIVAGALALAILGLAVWLSWPHLRFWWLFEPLGLNAQGYSEYRHRRTGIVFVSLPGGKFWMGAQKDDPRASNYDADARPEEGPVHEVTLSAFMIGKHEVTRAEWARVTPTKPSYSKHADLPVEQVSWKRCQEFCKRTGLQLPTEAQWEHACRGGATGPFGGTGRVEDMGWFDEDTAVATHPVGKKCPNGFGLHDMHGSVFEWCEDVFNGAFYTTPDADRLDPVCTRGSDSYVYRGGAFMLSADLSRCARRFYSHPSDAFIAFGIRVVASPPP